MMLNIPSGQLARGSMVLLEPTSSVSLETAATPQGPVSRVTPEHGSPAADPAPGQILIVLPSLKISGGQVEALRIASEVSSPTIGATLVTMWLTDSPIPNALPVMRLSSWMTRAKWAAPQLPVLLWRFGRLVAKMRKNSKPPRAWLFTHYSTLPLSVLVPPSQRWFFVQGAEWIFVRQPIASALLRLFIQRIYRSGRVIAANPYLAQVLKDNDIPVAVEKFIWADASFSTPTRGPSDIDIVMVLRRGETKRLDLYTAFLAALPHRSALRVAFITPDDDIADEFRDRVDEYLLRPTIEQMRMLYARSAFFLMLSDHEGFGLPPLESMGSGCIPICRDSGGIHAYMTGRLARHVLPATHPIEQIVAHFERTFSDASARTADSAEAKRIFAEGLQHAARSSEQMARVFADAVISPPP